MKKFVIALGILFVSPVFVFATTSESVSVAELKAQISSLLKLVQELQSQIASQNLSGGSSGGVSCHTFNRDLGIGDNGDEASFLLTALARDGVATPRNTNFSHIYDETLASYVSAFQEKYKSEILTPAGLSNGTGYFGARTRAKLNQLYGCGNSTRCTDVTGTTCTYTENPNWYQQRDATTCPIISPMSPNSCIGGTIITTVGANGCLGLPKCVMPTSTQTTVACTMEAKICPDGKTVVSRTGPNCEFTACPTQITSKVTISSPNGGEQWQNSSTQTIKWSDPAGSNNGTYTVFITSENGSAYGIAGEVYGQNYLNWTVGQVKLGDQQINLSPSSNYYVQVVKQYTGTNIYDQSDRPFSIVSTSPSISVTSPNGGETYTTNLSTIRINYKSASIVGQTLTAYLYSPIWNNVQSQTVYADNFGYIDMNLTKAGGPNAGQYKITLCANNVSSPEVSGKPLCDSSDNYFNIISQQTNGTLSFSKSSFSATYTQGDALPDSITGSTNVYTSTQYLQSLDITNTSNVNVIFKISVPNKPSWLNTSYATDSLTVGPGQIMGLGAYLDPTTVANTPGTYTTNIILTGNFMGSPLSIPVTLKVVSSNTKSY